MEALPTSQVINKQEREYTIDYDKTKLKLKFTITSPLLKISIHEINGSPNYFYENTFNKETLVKINKCFLMSGNIEEILSILIYLIENKKYTVNKISENEYDLIFKIYIISKEENITLNLYKNYNITKDDIINNLIEKVQNLTKRVEELEKWKEENKQKANNLKDFKIETSEGNNEIKLKNISSILTNEKELQLIEKRLKNGIFSNKSISYKLLYCATKDGDDSKIFHQKCDNIQNQLVLIKTKEGLKFGGYTRLGYNSSKVVLIDKDSFIFSFDLMKIYDAIEGKETIYCFPEYGPTFGYSCDIEIKNKFLTEKGGVYTKMNRFKTSVDYELNGGNRYFDIKEIEVFKVIFE